MIEQGLSLYIIIVLILIALFVISISIPFYGFMLKRFKGLLIGCILQPIIFALLALILVSGAFFYLTHEIDQHRENAMVVLSDVGNNSTDDYASKWYLKPDGECFFEYGKRNKDDSNRLEIEDNDDISLYDVVPLDSFRVCVDDVITVQFDIKNRKVTAVNYDKPLEVLRVDWDKVEAYFNNLPSE